MIDAVVLSSFQHGATLYARRQLAKFDPRTFAELEANGLVREKTAADVEPKPAPAPRPPARSRAVKPAPALHRKPLATDSKHIVMQYGQEEPVHIPVEDDLQPIPMVGQEDPLFTPVAADAQPLSPVGQENHAADT